MQFFLLKNHKCLFSCGAVTMKFVFLIMLCTLPPPVQSDMLKLKIFNQESALKSAQRIAKQRFPDLNQTEIDDRAKKTVAKVNTQIADIKKALSPAPLYKFKTARSFEGYYIGRILDVITAPSGMKYDGGTPVTRYYYLFIAHDKSGNNESKKPVLVPNNLVQIFNEYDTAEDFVRLFSDRHELLDVPFGSEEHRAAIFSLFDPEGALELHKKNAPRSDYHLTEGSLTRFIKKGVDQAMVFSGISSRLFGETGRMTPVHVCLNAMDPSASFRFIGNGSPIDCLPVYGLLQTIIKGKRLANFDKDVAEMAKHTVGMLCAMAFANTAYVAQDKRGAAIRAHGFGIACHFRIASVLNPSRSNRKKKLTKELPGENSTGWFVAEDSDYADAALDVMLNEPTFTMKLDSAPYVFNDYLIDGYSSIDLEGPFNSRRGIGVFGGQADLMLKLLRIASGRANGLKDESLQKNARTVLSSMITNNNPRVLDRRINRHLLIKITEWFNVEDNLYKDEEFVFDMLCQDGIDSIDVSYFYNDYEQYIEHMFPSWSYDSRDKKYIDPRSRYPHLAKSQAVSMHRVIQMRDIAKAHDAIGQKFTSHLNKTIAMAKKRIEKDSDHPPSYVNAVRFLKLYENSSKYAQTCN